MKNIAERNEIVKKYFDCQGIEIMFLGIKENPIVLHCKTGESLNCEITDTGVLFKFTQQQSAQVHVPFLNLTNNQFNFRHWFTNSTKKKIYFFSLGNNFFKRYTIKNSKYIPIFTENLQEAYFAFRLERALKFKRKMNLKGIDLNIVREWNENLKTF